MGKCDFRLTPGAVFVIMVRKHGFIYAVVSVVFRGPLCICALMDYLHSRQARWSVCADRLSRGGF